MKEQKADGAILNKLKSDDRRVSFIHESLEKINQELAPLGSSILCRYGKPTEVWQSLLQEYEIQGVWLNRDYEPYARQRDVAVGEVLKREGKNVHSCKDQVIFEQSEILKADGTPYTVFTPYKKRWLKQFNPKEALSLPKNRGHLAQTVHPCISLSDLGFEKVEHGVRPWRLEELENYAEERDYPAVDGTSYLSVHLLFGTISVREVLRHILMQSEVLVSELIWREFFMQILWHFPQVEQANFRSKYDGIRWRNNEEEIERWKKGQTGYPLVDAGMRELATSGYMHNRVRMVCAGFFCKHLLSDWRIGEAWFAEKLLDFDLAANNGNWQWAAGTGCDAAPYFRVFNPYEQHKKFDSQSRYVRRWVPEFDTGEYIQPIVEHRMARQRAIDAYKDGISND
jgi:deoxyribodipyrimidine photo-lyase